MFQKTKTGRDNAERGMALHGLLFLTALCTLLLQVLLTRVLSVVMWYHFTFAVISIGLLGIAAGAIHFYRRYSGPTSTQVLNAGFWHTASMGLNLFAISVALPILLMTMLIATPTFSVAGAVLLLVYFVACAAPFYASGYITAAIFRFGSKRVSTLYALDLLGASLGCLLAIPLLDQLGGVGSLVMVGLLAAIGSALLALHRGTPFRPLFSASC